MSFQRVIIQGNLGQKPEVKTLEGGKAVTRLSVATSKKWKNDKGELQERTEWHRVQVWGKMAEACGQYLDKGKPVLVEGELQTSKWTDKEGKERYTTELVASNVQFLGQGGGGKREEAPLTEPQGPLGSKPHTIDDVPF